MVIHRQSKFSAPFNSPASAKCREFLEDEKTELTKLEDEWFVATRFYRCIVVFGSKMAEMLKQMKQLNNNLKNNETITKSTEF